MLGIRERQEQVLAFIRLGEELHHHLAIEVPHLLDSFQMQPAPYDLFTLYGYAGGIQLHLQLQVVYLIVVLLPHEYLRAEQCQLLLTLENWLCFKILQFGPELLDLLVQLLNFQLTIEFVLFELHQFLLC